MTAAGSTGTDVGMGRSINQGLWRAVRVAFVVASVGPVLPALAAGRSAVPVSPAVDEGAARYRACLARVNEDPFAAVQEARAWQDAGGGDPARHCAAAGMLALGQAAEAAEELEQLANAAEAFPDRQAALLAQAADAWLQAGRADRALGALARALAIRPADPSLLTEQARAHMELGQSKEALSDLDRAVDAEPLRAETYVLRAAALRRTGALDRAAADVEMALSLDPRQPDALLERGLLRRSAGDTAGAVADWTAVVNDAPGSAAAEMARRHLAESGHPGG